MSGHNSGYNTGCESIGPFVFIWLEGTTTAGSLPDTLKIDSTGTLFYNPSRPNTPMPNHSWSLRAFH